MMEHFVLTYPGEVVKTDDFFGVGRTINAKGTPTALRYELDNASYAVSFTNGYFYVNGFELRPAEEDMLLTNRKAEYRPIWFRRWYRTFDARGGEIDARWIIFLGWQFTEDGRNHKRMMQVHQDGTVGVG